MKSCSRFRSDVRRPVIDEVLSRFVQTETTRLWYFTLCSSALSYKRQCHRELKHFGLNYTLRLSFCVIARYKFNANLFYPVLL